MISFVNSGRLAATACLALLALALAGPPAGAAGPRPDAAAAPAADAGETARLVAALGLRCRDARQGIGCMGGNAEAGDEYDVEVSAGCGQDGFFAGLAEETAALSGLPVTGSRVQRRATLPEGLFVCVRGIARAGQRPQFYYVMAVPVASVAGCRGNALCTRYGDRPLRRAAPAEGPACHATGGGRYAGDCVQGWVPAAALDVFSNGL